MSRVLLISLVFAPDGVSTAQLMSELVVDLQRAGHRISVVTTRPHYNRDHVAEAAQPLVRKWCGLLSQSDYHGIPVIHTAMPRKAGGILARLAGFAIFHLLALVSALMLVERPDVILVPSPLLSAGALGWLVARVRGAAFIYNVQELYPEIAIKLGRLRSRAAIRVLRGLERFVYQHASVVTVISQGMRRAVTAYDVPEARVLQIPNFVDTDVMRPGPRHNAFSQEHGLDEKFVVCYAGNMGLAQGLEALIGAAELLSKEPDIVFLFVGDGVLREDLLQEARAKSLGNTLFVSHQPYSRVPDIYAASDVCVVPMVAAISGEGVPSKFMRIMACGRPVLAIADRQSDLANEIAASGGGVVVASSSAEAIAQSVLALHDDLERCRASGEAGQAYASLHYARHMVTTRYADLIERITPQRSRA